MAANACVISALSLQGVGKTAICEGLAQRIVLGDVPENLAACRLWSLDSEAWKRLGGVARTMHAHPDMLAVGALVAGAKFRGEFEVRKAEQSVHVSSLTVGVVP